MENWTHAEKINGELAAEYMELNDALRYDRIAQRDYDADFDSVTAFAQIARDTGATIKQVREVAASLSRDTARNLDADAAVRLGYAEYCDECDGEGMTTARMASGQQTAELVCDECKGEGIAFYPEYRSQVEREGGVVGPIRVEEQDDPTAMQQQLADDDKRLNPYARADEPSGKADKLIRRHGTAPGNRPWAPVFDDEIDRMSERERRAMDYNPE